MNLSFLPEEVRNAISHLNYNYLSEIRLRRGQPVIIEYRGEYKYINAFGVANNSSNLIAVEEVEPIILAATNGCIYNFTEQMKCGFITVGHGVRIGIAGEYVTQNGEVNTIKNITSLNIRIPHNIVNCAELIIKNLFSDCLHSVLIFSSPGLGKTTMLRDIALSISKMQKYNILIFDERNEISAISGYDGYDLGDRVDIVRCYEKKGAIASAIRAMKPQVIITDELYGDEDIESVKYATNCGITVIASSHICNKEILRKMPFEFFVQLLGIGVKPVIYDKNFNIIDRSGFDNLNRTAPVGK